MRVPTITGTLVLSVAALISAGSDGQQAPAGTPETVIAVPGASNQTPSAASLGRFIAVAWSAQPAGGKPDVYVAISRDGGEQFGAPVRVNAVPGEARVGGELPPRVALVPRQGHDPAIVVAFGAKTDGTEIRIARSEDGGTTFTPAKALQAPGAAGDRGWHALAVDDRGTAHVMWLDHRGLATHKAGHAAGEADAIEGVAMAQRSGLFYAADGPASAAERQLLSGVCYCCKVAMAAEDDVIIAAWRHVYAGNIRDIAFIRSTDGGRTFGAAGRVSTDDWHLAGCPDDGPAMALDAGGTAHIVWPTVMGGDTPEGAIFYAASTRGEPFSARVRVPTLGSPRPMHPQVVAHSPDRLTVAWDEVVDGVRRAAMRPVTFDEAGQPRFGATTPLGPAGAPSSYPVVLDGPAGPIAVYVSGAPGSTVIRVRR